MDQQRMKELIEQHIAAEVAGDTAGAVSVYTDDVEHDMIGSPTGPVHGPAAAQGFYDQLTTDLDTQRMTRRASNTARTSASSSTRPPASSRAPSWASRATTAG